MSQYIFILMEEGDFVAAYSSRKKAEADVIDLELRNWHIIEAKLL